MQLLRITANMDLNTPVEMTKEEKLEKGGEVKDYVTLRKNGLLRAVRKVDKMANYFGCYKQTIYKEFFGRAFQTPNVVTMSSTRC